MRYSIEPRERRYVKGYGFLSFARNIGTHAAKTTKNMSNKYSQKFVDTAKKSATDAIKTASKRAIQKTAEATGDLIGNKIADKIKAKPSTAGPSLKDVSKDVTNVFKKSHNEEIKSNEVNNEIAKERYISLKERQKIIDELRLI